MRSLWTGLFFFGLLLCTACGSRTVVTDSSYAGYDTAGTQEQNGNGLNFTNGNDGNPDDPGASCLDIYNAISVCYSTYYECSSACQDQDCADACEGDYNTCFQNEVDAGSVQGQNEFSALRTCEEENYQACYDEGGVVYNDCSADCSDQACADACGEQANAVLQECMVESCNSEYGLCGVLEDNNDSGSGSGSDNGGGSGGNSGGSSGGGNSGFTCGELYDCEDACDGNRSCGQVCYDNGTELAQEQWTALIQCGQNFCDSAGSASEYRSCLQSQCSSLFNTCFAGGGGSSSGGSSGGSSGTGGYGTDTCGDGYGCIQSCYTTSADENSFYTCVDGCYNSMSTAAVVLMNELTNCSNTQCADVPGSLENYYQCQQDFCPSEYNACVSQGGATSSSSGNHGSGGGSLGSSSNNDTCSEIHYAVIDVCVPAYSQCVNNCNTEDCADACGVDINNCIEDQKSSAPNQEAQNFQEVLECRTDNRESCNTEADNAYDSCAANCGTGDTTCTNACADDANETYESCFEGVCSSEYTTCGLLGTASTSSSSGSSTAIAGPHDSCSDIWDANVEVCSPTYYECYEGCSTDSCKNACLEDHTECMDDQKDAAPQSAVTDYEALESCRNDAHTDCRAEGQTAYDACVGDCSSSDTACQNECNTPANNAYNDCQLETCSSEYNTCGIE